MISTEILGTLVSALLVCPFTAAFTLFVRFCLQEGNIFGWYGCLIEKWSENPKLEYWLKPLGGCVYCFGTWIFIVLFLGIVPSFGWSIPEIVALLLGCGLNYMFIEFYVVLTE